MEKFVVSARKYRPITFDAVVGQSHITTTLQNAIRTNHLAQAFLFCGPRGVGKTTCARILAKTINCQNLTEDTSPCNECESCKSFNNNASFNIHELDAASNNSVEDIRNLTDQVRFPPQHGKYKVYIIDEVHMLSQAAFNAFLKTLEEPPSYAVFILATTEKHKILPTILSRCQIFDFNRIQIKDIADHLANVAKKVTLVHRSESFRGAPDSLNKVMALAAEGKIDLLLNTNLTKVSGDTVLQNVTVIDSKTKEEKVIVADNLIPLFGLSPKLGPIENWGLNIDKNAIEVNTDDYTTNIEGVYAIGDINTYKNKLKLILCGFHEAALMSHSAYKYINPGVKYTMKYTTVNGVNEF